MNNPYTVGGYFVVGKKPKTVGNEPFTPNRWWHCGAGNGLPARIQDAVDSGALSGCGCGCNSISPAGCGYFNSMHNW